MTPTIVMSDDSTLMVRPRTLRVPPSCVRQNASLTMTDGDAPGRSSFSTKVRPITGFRPNTEKNSRDTTVARARTGSASPFTVIIPPGCETAIDSKARVCAFQSSKFGTDTLMRLPSLST